MRKNAGTIGEIIDVIGYEKDIETKLRVLFDRDKSEFHRPTYYEFIRELPLTAAGKVDYRKLEEMY